jgi:hypothetical protein
MKMCVVAVRDSAVGAFNRPFYAPSIGVAVRSFSDEVNRKAADNIMSQHPEDFELWYIANFDEELGRFETIDARVLARGKDVVQ